MHTSTDRGAQDGSLDMSTATNASIKKRLILCLIVLSIISVVQVAGASVLQYTLYRNSQSTQLLNDVAVRQMLTDMKHDSIQGDVFRMMDALQRNNPAAFKDANDSMADDIGVLDEAFGFVQAQTYSARLSEQVRVTGASKAQYVEKARAVAARFASSPQDFHRELDAYTAAFDDFEKAQEDLEGLITAEIKDHVATSNQIVMISVGTTLLTILIGAAALAWSGQFVLRSIIQPIERLAAGLLRMARGDYAVELAGRENGDEVERMAAAATVFRDTAIAKEEADRNQQKVVTALSTGLQMLAEKKLDHQIDQAFPADYEQLRLNYNSATLALGTALGSVRSGADTVATAIGEIRVAADDLSRRNEQQAASLE